MGKNKFPKISQWKQIFKVLKKGERIALLVFAALAFVSLFYLARSFYISNTNIVPASGGTYTEGIVGQPRFINPIYSETNDVDRALTDLVFSGLMSYDKDGKLVNDLVDSYTISSDGKVYSFVLKDNISWHDGKPLTSDDVIFTIKTIQNSDYKSPLRANWVDVLAEKASEKAFTLRLQTPYNSFLENCTIKIIPQHIWSNISAENFALSSYNLQPIGSGMYKFENLEQIASGFVKNIDLSSNHKYYGKVPYISNLTFKFFEKKEDLVKSANEGNLDGFPLSSLDNSEVLAEEKISQSWTNGVKFNNYSFSLPRYFAVFFNSNKDKILSDAQIRQALNYSVNKTELIKQIDAFTKINSTIVDSPILPNFFGFQGPSTTYSFDIEKAKSLLDSSGYKDNGSGQRSKQIKKTAAFQFTSYLYAGSKGNEVTQLQSCLAKLGFSNELQGETNGTYGSLTNAAVTKFQEQYLPDEKPTGETGKKTRVKLNELCTGSSDNSKLLQFTLVTTNQPQLVKVAELLKNYWKNVGVEVEINAVETSELKTIIKGRNYDMLLYGEALGAEPDLYPFWHSSQVGDPGLNLSGYSNKDADALLKDARETLDSAKKTSDYEQLQNTIMKEAPALFLYNPDYVCWISKTVKGIDTVKIIDPSKRFSNIENWYISTKRVWN